MEIKKHTKIENKNSISTLIESGIILNDFNAGAELDTIDLVEARKANREIADGKRYAVLISMGYLTNLSKEAREKAASDEFVENTVALALLSNSVGQKIVGNFYLKVNKPIVNTRLFTNREDAVNWLREQLNRLKVIESDWK